MCMYITSATDCRCECVCVCRCRCICKRVKMYMFVSFAPQFYWGRRAQGYAFENHFRFGNYTCLSKRMTAGTANCVHLPPQPHWLQHSPVRVRRGKTPKPFTKSILGAFSQAIQMCSELVPKVIRFRRFATDSCYHILSAKP